MVYRPEYQLEPGSAQPMTLREIMEQQLKNHLELEWVESPFGGLLFQFIPSDLDRRQEKNQRYIDFLNREIYSRIRGERFLFFQNMGKQFLFRIHFLDTLPQPTELYKLFALITITGRETDAAMRAAAFSH